LAEHTFQRAGAANADDLALLGKALNADYVADGHIQKFGDHNLLFTSVVNVETFQLIAGDYREYKSIEDIPALLPAVAEKLIASVRRNTAEAPSLAVLPFEIQTDVNRHLAEVFAQMLAIDIANTGAFRVIPRLTETQQYAGATAPETLKAAGEAVNARYILSGNNRKLGTLNIVTASIRSAEDGSQKSGGYRYYRTIMEGASLMPELGAVLTGADQAADAYEPDTRDSPIEVLPGDSKILRTLHGGDEDWFSVYAETGGILVFDTAGSTDTYMELYNADFGSMLTYADDGGTGNNARIEYRVESGNCYAVKVRGAGQTDTGLYRFGAAYRRTETASSGASPRIPRDSFEPDALENPAPADIGAPGLERTIHTESDTDWFIVTTGDQEGTLVLETTGSMDTYMELRAQSGECLRYDDDSGTGGNARIIYQALPETAYIVKVQGYSGITGSYRFAAAWLSQPEPDAYEPDAADKPAPADIGAWLDRTISNADEDWFAVTAGTEGGILVFETAGDTDTYMELYGAEDLETLLASNDDGGTGSNAKIEYFAAPEKAYIVKVYGYSGAAGSYRFAAVRQEPLELNRSLVTRILAEDGEQWFTVQPEEADILIFETKGPTDTYMELFDPNTHESLKNDNNSGINGNAKIEYAVEAGKSYVVRVSGYQDPDTGYIATGSYQFRAGWGVAKDDQEPDSWDKPVPLTIGAPRLERTIHKQDEDWFAVTTGASGGVLVFETAGDTDAIIELYDRESQTRLSRDDNSGVDGNARLEYFAAPNTAYIVKIRGETNAQDKDTGTYQFSAVWQTPVEIDASPGNYYYLPWGGHCWVTIQPKAAGTLVLETRGPTDTYMELFDPNTRECLASDDNSGAGVNARIEYAVQAGKRYVIKISGYQESDTGYYPTGYFQFRGATK
jgi:TolB-like protein